MNKILDQFGRPIDKGTLKEPQTANIAPLQNQYLTPMLAGLTPARLARTLQEADQGNLFEQHRLFADMEERDGHLRAEMDKRKNAIASLAWDIVPPRNATAAEKADCEWVREMLQDGVDPIEDLILAMMEAVGHGFAAIELEWKTEDGMLLPGFHPRPQEWFRLNVARTQLHLADSSVDGAPLTPFGWVMHTNGKAKTGYAGRMGLHRTLAWPFMFKGYALGDFAELLETFGLPFITGKYNSGATADEKSSLMRAVAALGHNARAIMPAEMAIEIETAANGSGGGESGHMRMMEWADKTESKCILGQTLSADTGSGGGGSYALGKVHNEVRHDIADGDARQIAATITRDLIYPLVAMNRPGISSAKRAPRLVLDTGDAEDITAYAESLPKLVGVGFKIPRAWAQEKLRIPEAQGDEEVLVAAPTKATEPAAPDATAKDKPPGSAALSAVVHEHVVDDADPNEQLVDQLAEVADPATVSLISRIEVMVESATDLAALQRDLVATFGGKPDDELVKLMGAAFALAELKGMSDVQDGR